MVALDYNSTGSSQSISDDISQISEVSVFIPKQQIQELGVNFLDVLRKISPEDLFKKQRAIALIASRLQYSNVRFT